MLFLDGVFSERTEGGLLIHPTRAPTAAELSELARTLALRVGRCLENARDYWNGMPRTATWLVMRSMLAHWRSCREPRSPTAWRLGRSRAQGVYSADAAGQ